MKYQTPNSTQTTRSTRWLKSRGGTEVYKYAHQLCDCMEGAHSYTPLGARLFAPACRDRPLCLSECRTVTVIFFFLVFFLFERTRNNQTHPKHRVLNGHIHTVELNAIGYVLLYSQFLFSCFLFSFRFFCCYKLS